MAEMTIQDLYKLFEDNNLSPTNPVQATQQPSSQSFIKVGDIIVASVKNREFRGEVSKVYEKSGVEQFDIKVGTTIISVKMDSILEHYPKNRKFEQKNTNTVTEIKPVEIVTEKKVDIPLQTQTKTDPSKGVKGIEHPMIKPEGHPVQTINPVIIEENKNDKTKTNPKGEEEPEKVLKTQEEIDEDDDKKNPENKNFNETVKVIGRITHFSGNLKLDEVVDFLAKKGIDKEKCWYFITERNNDEIHLIRNNDKGFQIYPFVLSFIDLKIKERLTESNSKEPLKINGNNQFAVIKNIPSGVFESIQNGLIALLSQTK